MTSKTLEKVGSMKFIGGDLEIFRTPLSLSSDSNVITDNEQFPYHQLLFFESNSGRFMAAAIVFLPSDVNWSELGQAPHYAIDFLNDPNEAFKACVMSILQDDFDYDLGLYPEQIHRCKDWVEKQAEAFEAQKALFEKPGSFPVNLSLVSEQGDSND